MTYYHMAPVLEQDIQKTLPHGLAHVVISRWQRTANPATGLADLAAPARADRDAFRALKAVQNLHLPDGLDLSADNETIEARAQALAAKFEQKEMLGMGYKHMMDAADKEGIRSAEVFEQQLRKIAKAAESDDEELLAEGIAGIKGRLKEKKWWKRQLYKFLYRAFEADASGCISPTKHSNASSNASSRREHFSSKPRQSAKRQANHSSWQNCGSIRWRILPSAAWS